MVYWVGVYVGFDFVYVVGNVYLKFYDWGVDFVVWCSYKYLNFGFGGLSGVFVYECYGNNFDLFCFVGWWGYDENEWFLMCKGFYFMLGVVGW